MAWGVRSLTTGGMSPPAAWRSRRLAFRKRLSPSSCILCMSTISGGGIIQPLVVGPGELAHPQSHDECLHYCEREFGAQYRTYAAALLGMSDEEFARYEDGRRWLWDR
jgi:hypothetical protein